MPKKQDEIENTYRAFDTVLADMNYDTQNEMCFYEGFARALEYVKGMKIISIPAKPKQAWEDFAKKEGLE